MGSIDSNQFDIVDVYRRYCDIKYKKGYKRDEESLQGGCSREALNQLLKLVETRLHSRSLILEQISKLMSTLEAMVDFSDFSRFYDFSFFTCRENGQKNISVSRAVSCWRLILAGRFRLLNQWCDFVEKNQRHNISEDTWKQVLAFSRCVHENLQGYDPEGAWPVLIDDFVEYMYRAVGYSHDQNSACKCDDSGLKMFPGVKRKIYNDVEMEDVDSSHVSTVPAFVFPYKRRQIIADKHFTLEDDLSSEKLSIDKNLTLEDNLSENASIDGQEITKNNNITESLKSPCAVEGYLSKGFAGLFMGRSCLRLDGNKNLFDI